VNLEQKTIYNSSLKFEKKIIKITRPIQGSAINFKRKKEYKDE
jgi:hypothetical protein